MKEPSPRRSDTLTNARALRRLRRFYAVAYDLDKSNDRDEAITWRGARAYCRKIKHPRGPRAPVNFGWLQSL